MNETFLVMVSYAILLFTNSGSIASEYRQVIGVTLIGFLGLLILSNFAIIVRVNVKKMSRKMYLKRLSKRR